MICKIPEGESIGACAKPADKDKDKNKHKDNNGGNGGNGGNGDGIFWPSNIPWFANNPAYNGTLEDLQGG